MKKRGSNFAYELPYIQDGKVVKERSPAQKEDEKKWPTNHFAAGTNATLLVSFSHLPPLLMLIRVTGGHGETNNGSKLRNSK